MKIQCCVTNGNMYMKIINKCTTKLKYGGGKCTTPKHTTKRTSGPWHKNKTTNGNTNNEVCIALNTVII